MVYQKAFSWCLDRLQIAGVMDAAADTWLLLQAFCGINRSDVLAFGDRELEEEKVRALDAALQKREMRIPLQLIIGEQEFMGLSFFVSDKVLIPRLDTEFVAEEVLRHLHDGMKILDLCTGSGCLLISLLHYTNGCVGLGTDISPDALELAQKNADTILGVDRRQVRFQRCDLFPKDKEVFDVIVANPPYIPSSVIPELMPEVRLFEPLLALDGGADGLDFYRRIIGNSDDYLERGGMLFLEIGHDQGERVQELLDQKGFLHTEILQDYGGCDRVAWGVWEGGSLSQDG